VVKTNVQHEGETSGEYPSFYLFSQTIVIKNQEQHNKRKTFREEYIEFLKRFNITCNEKYILKEIEIT